MTLPRLVANTKSVDLSAKITKSVCLYLEAQGAVVGDFLERANLPSHVALDAERWISAEDVECFLDIINQELGDFYPREVALAAPEVRGWGLLDQVLRILESSSEIYQNPKQFLSYFIRPDVHLDWLDKKEKSSSFEINLSTDAYPLVTDYLAGALEAVAKFSGGDSQVSWIGTTVSLDWSKKQESIFAEKEPLNYKPEVYKEAVAIIHKQQKELVDMKLHAVGEDSFVNAKEIINDLSTLEDYFLRSRQLVSLLKAESGNKKWFKEAMKRLNWDELQGLYSKKVEGIKNKINHSPQSSQEDGENQIDLQLM